MESPFHSSPFSSTSRNLGFTQLPSILLKLDRANYAFWRALVLSSIRAHGYEDFLSSTAIRPSPFLPTSSTGEMTSNPEFLNWIRRDQYLMSWMLSSVGETMLGHVVRSRSSSELWTALESHFQGKSKAQTMQYRVQLQNTKKGNLSVEDYFMKMRGIADQLAAIGKPLDDEELVMYLMAGFGPEYEALVVNTLQRPDSPSLQDIQLAFQAYEVRLAQLAQQHSSFMEHSANLAYRGRGAGMVQNFGRGGGAPRGGRSSPVSYNKSGLICQLCGRNGHVALKCFKRFDIYFTGNESPTVGQNSNVPPKAFVSDLVGGHEQGHYTGHYTDADGNWYVDSGATTHITNDLNNLSISADYSGPENLMVGNGQIQSSDITEGDSI